jgi:hypothetical protein
MFSGCKKETTIPSRVENFAATTSDGRVSLEWEIPLYTGGKITGYEITMDNWTNKVTKNANQFSHTYTNLTNNKEHTFKIRALNAKGEGREGTLHAKPSELDGIYVGTYTTTNLTSGFSWSYTPTIEFQNGKYTYKGLSDGGYSDSGSGKFSIKDNKITFQLTYNRPSGPYITIGVIDGWLLKGTYEYEFDGNKLIFSKTYQATGPELIYRGVFELEREAGK